MISRSFAQAALLTIAASLGVARAEPLLLPPLTAVDTGEHHVGKAIWADLVTPDLAASKGFYGPLFGWTFRDLHLGEVDYAVALLGERPVAGLLQRPVKPGEPRQPAWLTFLAVRDVDAARRIALSHGARVLAEPRTYAGRGRQAIFSDPQGAVFALLSSQNGDPPDYLAAPGEWIWSSLHARDPGTEAAFYQTLLGYEVYDLPTDDGLEHVILSSDAVARASVNGMPPDHARRHPHWLNFVRVLDATDAAARAVAAGGRVLVEPHLDRHGGRIAVIADPAGAPFGVMEWSAADSKEEPR